MNRTMDPNAGIQRLVEKCREKFRCPENTNYYDEGDFKEAERKYVKFCLTGTLNSDINPL